MNYLVTGATGGFGRYALDFLKELVPNEQIYGLARSKEKAQPLQEAGYQVRIGNYDSQASMEEALTGIDRLLFVSGAPGNRQAEHENVVNAAKKAGVSYIAYTSFAGANQATSALAVDHLFTEKKIEAAKIPHTFLRNNWYLENELPLITAALASGTFSYAGKAGKVGWALKREYAKVAAKAVSGVEYPEILELSGVPVDYAVLAQATKMATGKNFEVVSATDQAFIDSLVAQGMPKPIAEMFLSFQVDIRNNQLDVVSNDFEKALGEPLVSLEAGIKELLNN